MNSCVLTCVEKPDQAQQQRLLTFLQEKYGAAAEKLEVRIDPSILGGFVLTADGYTYDYSVRGRIYQMGEQLKSNPTTFEDPKALVESLRKEIQDFTPSRDPIELGEVTEVSDGIVTAKGLPRAVYGDSVQTPACPY